MGTELFEDPIYWPKSIEEIYANEILQINDWEHISIYYKLTEEFLETFKHKIDWSILTQYNSNLSFELVDKFTDYFDWDYITKYWKFNSDELKYFSCYINWDIYFSNYNLPDDFSIEI